MSRATRMIQAETREPQAPAGHRVLELQGRRRERASSTRTLDLALVSKNLMPNSSASACPWLYGTRRLASSMSHLLPTSTCILAFDGLMHPFPCFCSKVLNTADYTHMPDHSHMRLSLQ